MIPAAANWAPSLIIQSRSQMSSATPTSTISVVAPRMAHTAAGFAQKIEKNGCCDDARNAATIPTYIAMPPRRGVGVLWTSRSRMPG